MNPLRGTIAGRIVPAVRVGRERWTKRAKRYASDKDANRAHLLDAATRAGLRLPLPGPYVVEAHCVEPPAGKKATNPGGLSLTSGDAVNIAKALEDAAQPYVIPNDGDTCAVIGTRRVSTGPDDPPRVDWVIRWAGGAIERMAELAGVGHEGLHRMLSA